MSDPATTVTTAATAVTTYGGSFLVAAAGALLSHQFGPIAVMAGGGLAGAMLSVGDVETTGKLSAAWYVLRFSFAAIFVAGGVSTIVERFFDLPPIELLGVVAFCFGYIGGRWKSLLGIGIDWVRKMFGRAPGGPRT